MTLPPVTLRILAAGSLRAALTELARDWPGSPPELVFGPAGLLRGRIAGGEACDLFLSANLDHPRALAAGRVVTLFARNSLVAVARPEFGLTPETMLDRMLAPGTRIGTSTPGADPGGDYAVALFARAGRLHPGAEAALAARARHLVGGPDTPQPDGGTHPLAGFLRDDMVEIVLCYRTTALAMPGGFAVITPPAELAVAAKYGLVVLAGAPGRQAAAEAFVAHLLSPEGRAVLDRHGFGMPD